MNNNLKIILRYFLFFLFFFSIFLAVHLSKKGFWSIDDPYYHAKHSFLIEQTLDFKLVKPWLEFHFLNYAPTDPWWGYHLLMAGSIHFFGIFLGAKILTAILASLIFLVFYFLLHRLNIKRPFAWTLLFFGSSSFFQYRLFLERPFLLALIILPIAFWLLVNKKNIQLLFLSVIFAVLYNLAPLIILMAIFYILIDIYISRSGLLESEKAESKSLLVSAKPFYATFFGVGLGILLHPYSLNYIYVMYIHFCRVIFLRLAGVDVGIGNEVQVGSFPGLISNNFIFVVVYIISLAIFFSFKKLQKNKINLFLFLISGFWFLVTLLIPRGGDFWLPFGWLFVIFNFKLFSEIQEYQAVKSFLTKKIEIKILKPLLISLVIILIFNNFVQIFNYLYQNNTNAKEDVYYEQANAWLKANTPANSLVFYNNWSYWPRMFFYNDHNHYITGMDPTFLYEYDKNLFWLWNNISKKGIACNQQAGCLNLSPREKMANIKKAIKEKFRSDYVFITNDPEDELLKVLKNRKQDFEEVFSNEGLLIYKIKNTN